MKKQLKSQKNQKSSGRRQPKHPYVMTEKSVAITVNGRVFNFTDAQPNWTSIRSAIAHGRWAQVEKMVDIVASIKKFSHGRVTVVNGEVSYDGKPIHNAISQMIVKMQREDNAFKPLVRFMDKLMQNPLESAREELYGFLEVGQLPITPSGDFLAFKKVNDDYTDIRTGKMNNSVGKTVRMKRADVNTNRHETCSSGLHFCSAGYLSIYDQSQRTIIIKINPKDVVSIPSDYNNTKGRCCHYVVVGEVGKDHPGFGMNFTMEDMNRAIVRLTRSHHRKQTIAS